MKSNWPRCLAQVLKYEGGYVNHPKDPGGPTNQGVTERVYDAYRKDKHLPIQSVQKIEPIEVSDIYQDQYWNKCECDRLPSGIDFVVFDYAVNSGVNRASRALQAALGVVQDARIANETLNAAKEAADLGKTVEVIKIIMDARLAFLQRLKTWNTFGTGWGHRVSDVRKNAEDLAKLQAAAIVIALPPPDNPPAKPPVSYEPEKAGPPKEPAASAQSGGLLAALASIGAAVLGAINAVKDTLGETLTNYPALALVLFAMVAGGAGIYAWRKAHEAETPT